MRLCGRSQSQQRIGTAPKNASRTKGQVGFPRNRALRQARIPGRALPPDEIHLGAGKRNYGSGLPRKVPFVPLARTPNTATTRLSTRASDTLPPPSSAPRGNLTRSWARRPPGEGRQRRTDDAVTGRKHHNRIRQDVKGSPAHSGKKHYRYPRQEHQRHDNRRPALRSHGDLDAGLSIQRTVGRRICHAALFPPRRRVNQVYEIAGDRSWTRMAFNNRRKSPKSVRLVVTTQI
jgi:hypothetical protein